MPRAEAYGSSFVYHLSHYAEGGATEVYCNRAVMSVSHYAEGGATVWHTVVVLSVILSATHISSLAEN